MGLALVLGKLWGSRNLMCPPRTNNYPYAKRCTKHVRWPEEGTESWFALNYAMELKGQGADPTQFLHDWRYGYLSRWPDYITKAIKYLQKAHKL